MKTHFAVRYCVVIATLVSLSITPSTLFSQKTKMAEGDVTNVTKLTFLLPGISQEMRIGKFQTLHLHALMNLTLLSVDDPISPDRNDIKAYFDPSVKLGYRYYYNYKNRYHDDRRTEMNSMNYVGPVVQYISSKAPLSSSYLEQADRRGIMAYGVIWGFQRNYKSRFSLDFNVGPGVFSAKDYYFVYDLNNNTESIVSKNHSQFTLLGDITLGIWLNKKK